MMQCVLISVLEKPNFKRRPFIQKGFFLIIFRKAKALYQKARNMDFLVVFRLGIFTAVNEGCNSLK